ncbi:GNAT family N-acetyltransferase [Burkholderia ubonensis]|uniref:GNAT family N-acetyltransferase n=1 Tax=Burkholderia ubonensis TaxID=101571 RepID=UPI002AB02D6B|nr:GNAT family N-acetyltransferase [Burkholderia ubonensis]
MTYTYTLTDHADESIRKQIVEPLVRFNEAQAGPSHYRPLVVMLSDAEDKVVGGMWGATGYGWLFTQLLVVPESARGRGVGTRLMQLAEQEAIARGCHGAWLDTHEFQARPFYERLGYVCFGELPDYPVGHSRIFLRKKLGG